MKSLTSTRLADFLGHSNKSVTVQPDDVDSNNQTSIVNLGRAMFESDECIGEAPALVVAKMFQVDPTKNLQAILESYRMFREEVSSS